MIAYDLIAEAHEHFHSPSSQNFPQGTPADAVLDPTTTWRAPAPCQERSWAQLQPAALRRRHFQKYVPRALFVSACVCSRRRRGLGLLELSYHLYKGGSRFKLSCCRLLCTKGPPSARQKPIMYLLLVRDKNFLCSRFSNNFVPLATRRHQML